MGAAAEMIDRLVLELLLGDPIVEMHVARADVLVQVPLVGPVVHLQHRFPPGIVSSLSRQAGTAANPACCRGALRHRLHLDGPRVEVAQHAAPVDRQDDGAAAAVPARCGRARGRTASASVDTGSSNSSTAGLAEQRPREATRCCSPPDSITLQSASSSSRGARWPSPTAASAARTSSSATWSAGERIGHRLAQRAERKVRPLRHHQHVGAARQHDAALARRPQPDQRAEQARLAGARRAGDQHALARLDRQRRHARDRRARRQPHREIADLEVRPLPRRHGDVALAATRAARRPRAIAPSIW